MKPVNRNITDKSPVVISARGKVLGRLATEVATILRGKDNVQFESHLLSGRPVVVTHASEVVTTGGKLDKKIYYRHSGYIGGLTATPLRKMLATKPEFVIINAVKGMLPKNRLQQHWLANLEVRDGE